MSNPIPPNANPAADLVGQVLTGTKASDKVSGAKEKWKVTRVLSKDDTNSTGGAFSIPYHVINEETGKKAFLKVIDLIRSFQTQYSNLSVVEAIRRVAENHSFEVYLSEICRDKKMTRVVHAVDYGEVSIAVPPWGPLQFPFIIFELADGDVHTLLTINQKLDTIWKISTLHQIATAVQQLHQENIAHQDIKRSNVVFFGESNAKLTDLGRAVKRDLPSRNDSRMVPCQGGNAPPELLYSYKMPDWAQAHLATDLYMLGNLAFTLFFDVTMTSQMIAKIPEELRPHKFGGDYVDVLPALQHALGQIISEIIEPNIPEPIREDYVAVIRLLCNPNPLTRGHPKDHAAKHANKYSAERFISAFDRIKRKGRQLLYK